MYKIYRKRHVSKCKKWSQDNYAIVDSTGNVIHFRSINPVGSLPSTIGLPARVIGTTVKDIRSYGFRYDANFTKRVSQESLAKGWLI